MVNQQNGNAVPICHSFQYRQVPVVVGVGGIVDWANHLQGVHNHQHRVGILSQEVFHLLLQPLPDGGTVRTEVDTVWCVLGDLKETILDAEDRVFQAEIQGRPLPHRHSPDGFSFGHRHRKPQGQPGLAHFRRACQDMQPLGQQRVHHKVGRTQRLAHQCSSVHSAKFWDWFIHNQHLRI